MLLADEFLRAIRIEDTAIRQAIIARARETPQPYALVYALMGARWNDLRHVGVAHEALEWLLADSLFGPTRI
jgi:hypothetical protein